MTISLVASSDELAIYDAVWTTTVIAIENCPKSAKLFAMTDIDLMRQRIRLRLDALKKTPNAASTEAGLARSTLSTFLRKGYNSDGVGKERGLTSQTVFSLARVLNCSPDYLFGTSADVGHAPEGNPPPEFTYTPSPPRNAPTPMAVRRIPVIGSAAAGSFRPVVEFGDHEFRYIEASPHNRFLRFKHFALDVEGDSMNLSGISDGDTIICVDWVATGMAEVSGLIVVVERTINSGQMREWSVKEMEVLSDRVIFHPRSSNPIHKPIVVMRDHSTDIGMEVRIMALVVKVEKNLFRL